jgi:1-phosphofructokinase family hexose kinase
LTALDIVDDLVDVAETTRRNMTYIDPVAATETHVRECGFNVDKQDLSKLAQRLHRRVQKNDTVVFAGSMPLGMKGDDLVDLIGIAQAAGAFVALDLNGPEHVQVIAAKLDLVKPNLVELEQLCGAKLSTQQEVIDQARIIQKNARCVTVTMGKRGALAVDDNDVWFARPPKNKAVQSVGAGDAFLAGFLHQRVISSDPGDCLRTAVACGAASTLQTTAGLIDIADVDRLKKQVQLQRL